MNTALFIAKKILFEKNGEKRISKPIISIAIIGIALSMATMILSITIVTGFQEEIKNKVIGFGSHLQINGFYSSQSKETAPVLIKQPFFNNLKSNLEIKHTQIYATKPGIVETDENILGTTVKGVSSDFDWAFLKKNLVEGDVFSVTDTSKSKSVLISKKIANQLNLEIHDDLTVYFSRGTSTIRPRKFEISGIYSSGLSEFDKQFIFVDIKHIQQFNQWGIEAQIYTDLDCDSNLIKIEGLGFGGNKIYNYQWINTNLEGKGPHKISLSSDTSFTLVVSDASDTLDYAGYNTFLSDTATVFFTKNTENCMNYTHQLITTGGSSKYYTGGIELTVSDFKKLNHLNKKVEKIIPFDLESSTIIQRNPEIFSWLNLLDANVQIIIYLMMFVSVINMSSALLILILEKTNMIGILKAIGSSNWEIKKVFLYNAAYLIIKGLFWGNLFGIGLSAIQYYWKLFPLNEESYNMSYVPISFDVPQLIIINVLTIGVCLFCLLVPSVLISVIRPVKTMKFN